MYLRGKRIIKKSVDMGGYIVIGFMFGSIIGLLVGNLALGAGIGMCYGILISVFAQF